jgi:hypothetical protein
MLLRSASTGGLEFYDISNNQITGSGFMGAVGLDWQPLAFGNFSSRPGETDMILRNSNTGGLELYDISNNQITSAAFIGAVGLDWQFVGFAPIDGPGTRDLVMRNINTGQFEAYNITNDQITTVSSFGAVGLDWSVVGFDLLNGSDSFHMLTRSVRSGQFAAYEISQNQITGAASLGQQVGSDWQLGGFAVDPPTGSMGSSDGSTSQLVQAMAGFGGGSGAAESLNTVPLGADTSQQTLLTTAQHG